MELRLFVGSLTKRTPGKHGGKPNPHVNQKLLEHHAARESVPAFAACAIRRQLDASTAICLRPRGGGA
jgi:hypothetical protein